MPWLRMLFMLFKTSACVCRLSKALRLLSSNDSTPTTLEGTDPFQPDTGVVKFEGNNSSVTATVLDATNVTLDVDLNGDGIGDIPQINTSWAALTA